MPKETKKEKIDEYIIEAKTDIYVHIIMIILIFIILLFISYKVNWYYLLIFDAVFALSIISKIQSYNNVKEIVETLKKNKLLDKIGNVEYWNEYDYFLTKNYMIIIKKHIVNYFKYENIKYIQKELHYNFSRTAKNPDIMYITLDDESVHSIIINNNATLRKENSIDISDYLLRKNKNIKIEESNIDLN